MVSFDAVSLFINVPLSDTINVIANQLYDSNKFGDIFPVEKQKFKKLMYLATQSLFLHKDRLFKQIDGGSMGCPLGPTLANYF